MNDETFFEKMTGSTGSSCSMEEGRYILRDGEKIQRNDARFSGIPADAALLRRSGQAGHSCRVMDALYKYPYLDRDSLHAVLSSRDGKEFDDRKLGKSLQFLRELGVAEMYSYGDKSFYGLSREARNQLAADMGYKVSLKPDMDDAWILGAAGLCHWHAHAVGGGHIGKNFLYQAMRIAGREYLPESYMEFKRSVPYRAFAYTVPRDGNLSSLVGKITESIDLQLSSIRKGWVSLTVLVAPSLASAQACNEIFSRLPDTKGKRVYYALDSRTGAHARGFSGLCEFDRESGTLVSVGVE